MNHRTTLGYTYLDDGVHLTCECGWDENLGFFVTPGEAFIASRKHTTTSPAGWPAPAGLPYMLPAFIADSDTPADHFDDDYKTWLVYYPSGRVVGTSASNARERIAHTNWNPQRDQLSLNGILPPRHI